MGCGLIAFFVALILVGIAIAIMYVAKVILIILMAFIMAPLAAYLIITGVYHFFITLIAGITSILDINE